MDGAVNPSSITISIAMGTSLLAGLFSVWIAMKAGKDETVKRDPAVPILFGCACLLIVLYATAAAFLGLGGMAYFGLLRVALLLTVVFTVVGMVFGLLRGPRSGRAAKTHSA